MSSQKKSGHLVRYELLGIEVIEAYPEFCTKFKVVGWLDFCHKLQGHHEGVDRDFIEAFNRQQAKVGDLNFQVSGPSIVVVVNLPIDGERGFKHQDFVVSSCNQFLKPEFQNPDYMKEILITCLNPEQKEFLYWI